MASCSLSILAPKNLVMRAPPPGRGRAAALPRRMGGSASGRGRGLMVVRAGGPPSTNVLILAFVLPFSLFVGTLITASRVADDLDERFLREMEINKAIMEENEASAEDGAGEEDDDREYDEGEEAEEQEQPKEEKEPIVVGAVVRTRNRPRRQV